MRGAIDLPRFPSTCARFFVGSLLGVATGRNAGSGLHSALEQVATPKSKPTKNLTQVDGNPGTRTQISTVSVRYNLSGWVWYKSESREVRGQGRGRRESGRMAATCEPMGKLRGRVGPGEAAPAEAHGERRSKVVSPHQNCLIRYTLMCISGLLSNYT